MFDYDSLYLAVLGTMFPDPILCERAKAILEQYGAVESHREPSRVRLAVLKLAGPDLEALKNNISYALTDYRDVLAWAEYPSAIKSNSWRLPAKSPEKIKINISDQRQYRKWLESLLEDPEPDHDS